MSQNTINIQSMLKVGTILRGIYRIDSYLSSGGFGNTYVATNVEFEERVAIKEFFMKGVTQRDDNQTTVSVSNSENHSGFLDQKEKFKKEARRIRQLKNDHIVAVHDLFEENGTAYYVMDYVDGENLSERLKLTNRPMTESEVILILPQILDALKTVHDAGIWHLDLKPANIMLEKGGNVKLIDFGASKQLNVHKGGATTSTAISYTNGFAPREQMEQNYEKFGPWTDIYALGATLYNLLTNNRPPMPSDIDDDETEDKHIALPFPAVISDNMKSLVLKLMKTNRKLRPQGVSEVLPLLDSLSAKSFNSITEPVERKVVEPVDSEETIITTPKNEETIIETNNNRINAEIPTYSSSSYEATPAQEYDEETSNSTTRWIVLALCFIIGVIVYLGTRDNDSYDNSYHTPESPINQVVDNSNTEKPSKEEKSTTVKNGFYKDNFPDGSRYEGNYKDGYFHGQGIYIWPNGEKYEGEWNKGNRVKGTYTWPEKRTGYMYKYVGEFNQKGDFHGKGTAYYVGGEIDDGTWRNGNFVENKIVKQEKNSSAIAENSNTSSSSSSSSSIGKTLYNGNFKFEFISIRLEGNRTIINNKATLLNKEKDTHYFICSDKKDFIEDSDTGERYYIMSSDIGFTINKFEVTGYCYFREIYPPLPYNVKRINYYTGSQYVVRNYVVR